MPPPPSRRSPSGDDAPKTHVVVAPGTPGSPSFSANAFTAPHPRTGRDTQYLLHRRPNGAFVLLEASRYAPSHGSWFHPSDGDEGGNGTPSSSVCSDKGLLLLTEVDPLLVALPALDSARALSPSERQRLKAAAAEGELGASSLPLGRFVDAEAAVCGGERAEGEEKRAAAALPLLVALAGSSGSSPSGAADADAADGGGDLSPPSPRSAARLDLLRSAGDALSTICELKEAGGDQYYRLCERRARAWLRVKARRAAEALKARGGPAFAGLEGEALEGAGGALVAEWLPREWSEAMGWQCPGGCSLASAAPATRPAAASTAASRWEAAPPSTSGPFTRDPNLAAPPDALAADERYRAAGDFAKKQRLDAAAVAREKAKAARADAKALAAKKEASTMKSLAGFFVVKKKD